MNERIGYDTSYREESTINQQRYFPQNNEFYNNNKYNYNIEPIRTRSTTSRPRRNYFPIPEDDTNAEEYVPNQDPYAERDSTFIGEEQVLNAGYTVKDDNLEAHEYLTSSYETPDKVSFCF